MNHSIAIMFCVHNLTYEVYLIIFQKYVKYIVLCMDLVEGSSETHFTATHFWEQFWLRIIIFGIPAVVLASNGL